VEALDEARARAVGEICGIRGVSDVVDAFVAITGRKYGGIVITSDPDDLRCIDPTLDVRLVPASP
jgi:hypothetical protein